VVTGLVVDAAGFEVLAGDERIGSRRPIGPADVELLTGLAGRYVRAVQAGSDAGVFVELGRELYSWLDGDQGQLSGLLERAARPLVFEVTGPRSPSEVPWAVLRAPFELLARPGGGLLAEDELARFCAARRLGPAEARPTLDQFRLGLAFMESSPRDQHELDFEAEEAAVLAAVGEGSVDLVVDDTGDPEQLARRLAGLGGSYESDGLGADSDVAAPGASQLLLIADRRLSGEAVAAGEVAARITQQSPPEGEHVRVGVLTSCFPEEMARDGLSGQRLAQLLACVPEAGPDTRALLVRCWSSQSAYISGYDLCDAALKIWGTTVHTPDFLSHGSAWWMFPDPRYDPGAPERVVEHLLRAARGGAGPGERSWFTGRAGEVDQVAGWVRSGQPGLHVGTGPAGTRKTAIAGRVVSLSDPAERERLLAEGRAIGACRPGGTVGVAHMHARGLTADRAADLIVGQLVRAGVLATPPDRCNAAELGGYRSSEIAGHRHRADGSSKEAWL
jgi:hypothetical protein